MVSRCILKEPILFFFFIILFDLCCSISYTTIAKAPAEDKNVYVPKVKSKTCLLRTKEGPCRADIEMFYFEPSNMTCSKFKWGGCQGNGNRFDTEKQCLDYCLTKETDPATMPSYCSLEFDYGFCFGAAPRWYYDRRKKVCRETIYSGCGGNKNNFYSKENCENVCLWKKDIIRMPAPPTTPKAEGGSATSEGVKPTQGNLPTAANPGLFWPMRSF